MHEFFLTQNLLNIALQAASAKRIVRVHLLIGPFSEERQESIEFFWRDLAKGTPGDGAVLHFEHTPPSMKCLHCSGAFDFERQGMGSLCEFCASDSFDPLDGQEIRIQTIDFE
jgi:Zn finger protein HypA/HybF involved in hydrogenase expression